MTIATIEAVPTRRARERDGWPASTRIVVAYGFWIFILSDIVMFSALFAAYAVLPGIPPADRPERSCSTSATCSS